MVSCPGAITFKKAPRLSPSCLSFFETGFESKNLRFGSLCRTKYLMEYYKRKIKDDPYWTSRKNSLELIELSSINKVSLV